MANPKIGALQSLNLLRASVSSMVCILPTPPEADILLYGCNVAAGKSGQAFVNTFSNLTGADVAALALVN
jgi:hypothetical protein